MEEDLSAEIVRWLNDMKGYENISAEGLLILPIAKFFKDQNFDVDGDTDCYFIESDNGHIGKRGKINYDFYAEKGDTNTKERIILEIKWMKKATKKIRENTSVIKRGNANYARLITDFIKLAIPERNISKRLADVAVDTGLPPNTYDWFSQLKNKKKLDLTI